MPEPPFHKGDLLASTHPNGYFHCFVAKHEPEWDFDCWVYGSVVIHGNMRPTTEEDVERWLANLASQANFANDELRKADEVVEKWRAR